MTLPRRVLVANRGEIALRIARTCRRARHRVGDSSSRPGDEGSLHARLADETLPVALVPRRGSARGGGPEAGADAVHPGYGFLAESATFAEAVDRGRARLDRAARGGAPAGRRQARGEADRGGGRRADASDRLARRDRPAAPREGCGRRRRAGNAGRRRPSRSSKTRSRRRRARRRPHSATAPCSASAGCDGRGTSRCSCSPTATERCVALGDRDCSIQRRHQKVLEEAPAPGLTDTVRDALARDAVAFARAIGYVSAGTAEFLVDGEDVYFLELNGAHPGRASGHRGGHRARPRRASAPDRRRRGSIAELRPEVAGHAVEARLYAEDPRTFLPQPGHVERLGAARGRPGRRRRRGGRRGLGLPTTR